MSEVTEAMVEAGCAAVDYSVSDDEARSIYLAMREAAPVDEPVAKLQAMRRMCEASGQPFYVEILDEVLAALAAGDASSTEKERRNED